MAAGTDSHLVVYGLVRVSGARGCLRHCFTYGNALLNIEQTLVVECLVMRQTVYAARTEGSNFFIKGVCRVGASAVLRPCVSLRQCTGHDAGCPLFTSLWYRPGSYHV